MPTSSVKSNLAVNQNTGVQEAKTHTDPLKVKDLSSSNFPHVRMRRLRRSDAMRALVQENHVHVEDLIHPIFVEEDTKDRSPIEKMPGVYRESENSLKHIIKEDAELGIKATILFGVSHNKDSAGHDSLNPNGLMARMIDRAKQTAPEILIIADTCFCEYTDHGHCGVLDHNQDVDNDKTLENLGMQAVIAAEAGADIIAPSAMMDGQVLAIRHALDTTGFSHIPILSYASKFASVFYGPFRDAAGCSLEKSDVGKGDRKTYQMNPANSREAIREAIQDIEEGADMLMVKPGMPYLDILTQLRQETNVPLAAYQVSGEYAMIQHAAQAGAINGEAVYMESLMAFKRAGADMILTYGAPQAAKILQG